MKALYPIRPFAVLLMLVLLPCSAQAQYTAEEKEVLETLNTQLGHAIAGEFDENDKYMHPRAVFWGPFTPVPQPNAEEQQRLWQLERDNSSTEYLGFYTVPLTVEVVGNTAILNVYLYILRKTAPDSEPERQQIILHNTWVNEGGRWLLLATYNTLLEE